MTTRIINWFISKATGSKTIGESSRDSLVAYLTKLGVSDTVFDYVISERSPTYHRLMLRLYYGTGYRGGKKVAYIVLSDENDPRPYGGYFLLSGELPDVKSIYKTWRVSEERGMGFDFSSYLNHRSGEHEKLPADLNLKF